MENKFNYTLKNISTSVMGLMNKLSCSISSLQKSTKNI